MSQNRIHVIRAMNHETLRRNYVGVDEQKEPREHSATCSAQAAAFVVKRKVKGSDK